MDEAKKEIINRRILEQGAKFSIDDKEDAQKVIDVARQELVGRKNLEEELTQELVVNSKETHGVIRLNYKLGNIARGKASIFFDPVTQARVFEGEILLIKPESLRRGVHIGKIIGERMLRDAVSSDCDEVRAWAQRPESDKETGNHPYYFYLKHGFKVDERSRHYVEGDLLTERIQGGEAIPMVLFLKGKS